MQSLIRISFFIRGMSELNNLIARRSFEWRWRPKTSRLMDSFSTTGTAARRGFAFFAGEGYAKLGQVTVPVSIATVQIDNDENLAPAKPLRPTASLFRDAVRNKAVHRSDVTSLCKPSRYLANDQIKRCSLAKAIPFLYESFISALSPVRGQSNHEKSQISLVKYNIRSDYEKLAYVSKYWNFPHICKNNATNSQLNQRIGKMVFSWYHKKCNCSFHSVQFSFSSTSQLIYKDHLAL